jgi:hypothetical protein
VLRFVCRAGASGLDHDLDYFPLVHRAVAVGHLVEAHDPVEDSAGLDPAFEDVRQKLLDVRADRGGPAGQKLIPLGGSAAQRVLYRLDGR